MIKIHSFSVDNVFERISIEKESKVKVINEILPKSMIQSSKHVTKNCDTYSMIFNESVRKFVFNILV
jgi:hypothetical protein